ncbi:MAG: hypothetical protein NT149_01600 [Candidatus Gottesmanbacteria bacterium]|nr:hypothetical protein [Candidatus Gottesmanbacteria bacterium]
MIRLPNFHRLSQLKNQIISRIVDHKTLIIVLCITVISLVAFGIFTVKLKSYLLSKIEAAQQTAQRSASNDMYYATTAGGLSSNLKNLSASDTAVLGISNDSNCRDTNG